jgi:drug/metabolite transporter (DMT)-like permease
MPHLGDSLRLNKWLVLCSCGFSLSRKKLKTAVGSMDFDKGSAEPGTGTNEALLPPALASAAASIITGTALVATRYVVSQADGLTVAALRYVIAAICLIPLVPLFHRFNVARTHLFPIAALGILYFGFFPWCISAAMQYTTASEGAIVLACTPAMTLLLSRLRGVESLSVPKSFGVAFAILGAVLAFGGNGVNLGKNAWFGNLLMVIATLSGAVYAVYSKPYLAKYPPLTVTAIAMGAGAFVLTSLWAVQGLLAGAPRFTPGAWVAMVYIGAAGGALSFFLYAWALGRSAATATMILIPLNPIAAMLAGALCLGEPLSLGLFAGLGLVIVGIVLVVGMADVRSAPPKALETLTP